MIFLDNTAVCLCDISISLSNRVGRFRVNGKQLKENMQFKLRRESQDFFIKDVLEILCQFLRYLLNPLKTVQNFQSTFSKIVYEFPFVI
jgi:hypothetical protein